MDPQQEEYVVVKTHLLASRTKDVLKMITGSKRLDPSRTLEALTVRLRYPNYQKGLAAVWQQDAAAIRALAG